MKKKKKTGKKAGVSRLKESRFNDPELLSKDELITELRIMRIRYNAVKKAVNLLLDRKMASDRDQAVQGRESNRCKG